MERQKNGPVHFCCHVKISMPRDLCENRCSVCGNFQVCFEIRCDVDSQNTNVQYVRRFLDTSTLLVWPSATVLRGQALLKKGYENHNFCGTSLQEDPEEKMLEFGAAAPSQGYWLVGLLVLKSSSVSISCCLKKLVQTNITDMEIGEGFPTSKSRSW